MDISETNDERFIHKLAKFEVKYNSIQSQK